MADRFIEIDMVVEGCAPSRVLINSDHVVTVFNTEGDACIIVLSDELEIVPAQTYEVVVDLLCRP